MGFAYTNVGKPKWSNPNKVSAGKLSSILPKEKIKTLKLSMDPNKQIPTRLIGGTVCYI